MTHHYRRWLLVAGLLIAFGLCLPAAGAAPTTTNNTTTPATPPIEAPQAVTQGDFLTIDVGNGTAENVTLSIESGNYTLTAATDPNTTVRLNTYLAGSNVTSPLTNATVRTSTHRERLLPANTTLTITATTPAGDTRSTTVDLRPRTPTSPTVWRGSTAALNPETLTAETLRDAIATDRLTRTDHLVLDPNHTETVVLELDGAGLEGLFAATGATTPEDQLAVLREADAVQLNLTAITKTGDRKLLTADPDLLHVAPDFTNETIYLGLTVDPTGIDGTYADQWPPSARPAVNDTVHITPTITDRRLLGAPAAPLSGAVDNTSVVEAHPGTVTLTAPTTTFRTDPLRVFPTMTTVTLQTNRAPGTQGMLTVQSTDAEASFLKQYSPTVGPNGTVAQLIDFAGTGVAGDQFVVSTAPPFDTATLSGEIIDLTMAQPDAFAPNVTLDGPTTVTANTTYTLTATAGNSGDAGSDTLTIAVDNRTLTTTNLSLNSGMTTNYSVQATAPANATTITAVASYGTATDNTTITVNVTRPTDGDDTDPAATAQPGFGILLGLVALLVAVVVGIRRHDSA